MKYSGIIIAAVCSAVITGCSYNTRSAPTNQNKPEAIVSEANGDESSKIVNAMDTAMSIKAYGDNAKKAVDDAEKEILRLDTLLRRGSEQSEVYRINEKGSAEVSEDSARLIKRALEICRSTNGAFDITIAPVMDLWGFYTKDFYVPAENELKEKLSMVDYRNIEINGYAITAKNGANIDLGGIAKGYTSSRIAEIFNENNVESGIVSLGGNVQAIGTKPDGSKWRVAIQNPDNESYIGGLSISDAAVITSGGYQRFFEKDGITYHHIIDPSTGYPADSGLKSVSIVSGDGTTADGLSTADEK